MADSVKPQNASSLLEEELSVLIEDYSIPHIAELSPDSLLMQSQYAKVIFHDIADTYPTDADICCRYSLTDGVTPSHGDRIALFRVGWSSVQEYIQFEWAPGPPVSDKSELQVLFKASSLPKDVNEFYQLCYVTSDNVVCGASVPFQFRHPHENELCAIEEPGGLVVVRSRTALTDEKLRQTISANEQLQRDKDSLEGEVLILKEKCNKIALELQSAVEKLITLETEKRALEKRLEENLHMERHVERLQKDLLALDTEKNQSVAKLKKVEQHIQVLTATVDTLSADKEHMAQLLRSETQNKSGVVAEVSQYKGQVDSLSHMLEALTQSKEMVAQELRVQQATNNQLREDIQNLEIKSREQQNKISELEKEKKNLQELLEQTLSAEKASVEKIKHVNDLEKEKERLLSELIQSASKKEKEIKTLTEIYESRLEDVASKAMTIEKDLIASQTAQEERRKDILETAQVNKCLKQQLQEAQNIIAENERSLAAMESDLKKAIDAHKKSLEHNERLTERLMELESESAPLRLQLQESNIQQERHSHFKELFTDIEHKIANLKIVHEEAIANKNVQMERLDAIKERISELDVEEGKLCCELQDVAAIRDTQEDELAQKKEELAAAQESSRRSYLMVDGFFSGTSDIDALKESVNELTQFVDSSKMRLTEIDQRIREIEEEKSVLMQQQTQASERKAEYENNEEDAYKELVELQEHEIHFVREHGGDLETLQNQLTQALNHSSEILASGLSLEEKLALAKKEKTELQKKLTTSGGTSQDQQCSSLNSTEVNTCLEQEQQLKLRLEMAAAEYRKLYTEKQKVERRLAKFYSKLSEKKSKSSSDQSEAGSSTREPATAELISLSQTTGISSDTAGASQVKSTSIVCSICPICYATFPPGAYDLFTQHFDAHLS
ncbi:calcium-binding and coiled-coil domain-containing protein 1-like isoform X1 [Periplaneta americana]|uniref:calcium-binding and coiled-coil domain-containing protein 1-like isoform X1 n=1 Tax=Periplaneta americana TaxID=6978 RepID=UPI0037E87B19